MSKLLRQAELAEDRHLIARCSAAAATVGVAAPSDWAQAHRWDLAVTPGWGDFDSQSGISDAQIVERVCALSGVVLPAEPEPEPEPDDGHEENAPDDGAETETP